MKDDFDKWEQRAKENSEKIMSKEQTPINFLNEKRINEKDVLTAYECCEYMKQYAQAKVLEALESREHIDCGKDGVKTICPACKNVLWNTKQK